MAPSSTQGPGFRERFSERVNRFRRKLPHSLHSTSSRSSRNASTISSTVNNSLVRSDQTRRNTTQSPPSTNAGHSGIREDQPDAESFEQEDINLTNLLRDVHNTSVSRDLWSAAYREAIESLGKDMDVAILKGSSVAQLFEQLETIDRNSSQDSAFRRGVRSLHSIQVPLENFKLALDIASPLSSVEPTAATVFGVVQSVTAIAITFASADSKFAEQIGEMLRQLQYIDECDTLGQRVGRQDIHKALVPVYRKVLEFYQVAHEILTRRGARLVIKMVLETNRLPSIVQDFLKLVNSLQNLIEKATFEVVEDIKAMLYETDIDRWLGSDKATLQSEYHAALQEFRANDACAFLLNDSDFERWYNAPDKKWLTIFGDMGCGKSMAMSFVVDELRRRAKHQLPQPKTCFHYCRNDETGRAAYVFTVMILSLLEQLVGLKKTFHTWYKDKLAAGSHPAKNLKELEEYLEDVVKTLDRPLFIVIDGLDECDRPSRNKILDLLTRLSQNSSSLKIVLSFRTEVELLEYFKDETKICVSSSKQRDTTIVKHLTESHLSHLTEDVKSLIVNTLSCLAGGCGIWMRMTVKLIETRNIQALEPMRFFLKQLPLPNDLSALYTSMIIRYSSADSDNSKIIIATLKILAVARRHLSIQELAWAVALATVQQDISTVAELGRLVDPNRMMGLIHAFITHTDPKDLTKRQIQLVHHSVKEFIVQHLAVDRDSTTSAELTHMNMDQRIQILESFVLNICIRYLLLDEIGKIPLFSETQIAIIELPLEADLFGNMVAVEYDPCCTWEVWEQDMTRYDPTARGFGYFFVYAASHWIHHFSVVTAENLPDLTKVETLCQAGSVRLDNWTNQNCRPDCVIKARFEFESQLYDPLSITSLYGSVAALDDMLKNSDFDTSRFLAASPVAAAHQILEWGDLTRLRLLFSVEKFRHQLHSLEFFEFLMRRSSEIGTRRHDWDVAFDVIDLVSDTLVQEQWGGELLCMAAYAGCLPLVKHLLREIPRNPALEVELFRAPQSIANAVCQNHADVVQCLLEQTSFEKHLEYSNSHDENVLHLASGICNPTMMRLLVPHFQKELHRADNRGRTALARIVTSRARSPDRRESASILLSSRDTTDTTECFNESRYDPLRLAIQSGDTEMCRILILEGKLDPNSALKLDQDGNLVLKDEPQVNSEILLKLLQETAENSR